MTCTALHRNCSKCFKPGHFPKSKNCKAARKERFQCKSIRQVASGVLNLKTISSEMEMICCIMSPECLKLVEQRIGWIEKEKSDQKEDAALSPLRLRGGGLDMPFKIPAFKSQFPAVDAVADIFRSFQEDWSYFQDHPLCAYNEKKETKFPCFLCFIRNISKRICKPKQTRMTMQPIEILSQLDQFKALVNHDFTKKPHNVKLMLEKTLQLIARYSSRFISENQNLNMECRTCSKVFLVGNTQLLEIDVPNSEETHIWDKQLSTLIEAEVGKSFREHSELCQG
jgi:hypothetical protein